MGGKDLQVLVNEDELVLEAAVAIAELVEYSTAIFYKIFFLTFLFMSFFEIINYNNNNNHHHHDICCIKEEDASKGVL
jgi:hypothetical protein